MASSRIGFAASILMASLTFLTTESQAQAPPYCFPQYFTCEKASECCPVEGKVTCCYSDICLSGDICIYGD